MNPKGNPENLTRKGKGRPKGSVNKCTQVKEEFFQAYFKLGGLKNLLKLFADKKWCSACGQTYPAKHLEKMCTCGQRLKLIPGDITQKQFIFNVLPQLIPKKTEIEGKGISVVVLEARKVQKPPNSGLGEEERKQ
jgi:hypothetical protein